MEYKGVTRKTPVCLECGDKIRYGRTDKKFCCDDCRSRHYNRLAKDSRAFRRKIMRLLDKNYEILDSLVRSDVTSMDMIDLQTMGFSPGIVTSYRRQRNHSEYCCFDIKYIMSANRIFAITKIQNVSLPLQFGLDKK